MTYRHRLSALLCLVWLAASILLDREAALAQAPASAPQRQGQAFDEQFKNRIDEVRAGHGSFVTIFDGTSMNGWSVSAKSRHSSTSGNQTGGHWEVRDGMLSGHQDMPGNGGLFITDKKYGDFEVALETRNDFGMDSGIYLRSTDTGMAYQVMIDYRRNGSVGGVYGENMKPGFNVAAFHFLDAPDRITTVDEAFPMPILPASWPMFWRHGQWNEVRARIVGNPARITVWINGVKFTDYTDTMPRLAEGYLALQVHGGLEFVQGKNWVGVDGSTGGETDYTKRYVRFRNIRIKEVQ
jgi:hypothetical protein